VPVSRLAFSASASAVVLAVAAAAAATPVDGCPNDLHKRTAAEVLEDHRAALAAGDLDAAMCDYAEDAVVIHDGGIDHGAAEIEATLQILAAMFGGAVPRVDQEVSVSVLGPHTEMARVLFTVETACVLVPDGTDTYVVRRGKIEAQTAHGAPVFLCEPPPSR
jgi:ketosteroid isomerase-like protein